MSKEELLETAEGYNSIYLNNLSAFCARLSCGSLLELCKAVATGQVLNGVAIVRPPGHHAEPDEAGGFCLFNNVAVAARYLQKHHGLRKIFILDWDVHHGNGTQAAFIDDPDVVYCSIHRYDDGSFYPGDPVAAAHTTVGEGAGVGRNINIPWPRRGMGDSEYIYTFHKVIMPIIYEFSPDFILVSAGFDAAKGDHIGENLVTPAAYGHMTHMLKSLAGGKIILALEGGYNLDSIAVSGLACAKALLSDPIEALDPIVPNDICIQTIHEVMEIQSRYWKSLTPMCIDPVEETRDGRTVVELAKVLSVYRTDFLYQRHKMLKLPLSNPTYGADYLDSVHVTQEMFKSTKPLYIFVHGGGDFRARTMGVSNILRPDKSVLIDAVAQYVDKIVSSDNELVDIVVPHHPATEEEKTALKEKVTELLADIWDNYAVMTGRTRRIILFAAGFGCHSMVSFMNERQKDVLRYVSCVVLVPGGEESLPTVTKKLSMWYVDNSFVVVADDHPIWDSTNERVNNRLGNLVRSGRPIERVSDQLLSLFTIMFSEINLKLSNLPPLPDPEPDSSTAMDVPHSEVTGSMSSSRTHDHHQGSSRMSDVGNVPMISSVAMPMIQSVSLSSPSHQGGSGGALSFADAINSASNHGSNYSLRSSSSSSASHLLVDRVSSPGHSPRSQPYPAPNGRQSAPGQGQRHGARNRGVKTETLFFYYYDYCYNYYWDPFITHHIVDADAFVGVHVKWEY
ncbi:Histone deacetylase hda1 [Modicella reniformis]|uniref:histone deacetylase n=1 Tax=Modicella reniformis TaxID=1440133 RepID=A0A9P6MG81_9FUNG|nr:Histone deacetylase hda1 [Modicella reniformis]